MRKRRKYRNRYEDFQPFGKILGGLLITGMILLIWEINIFQATVIELYVAILIWLVSGALLALFVAGFLLIHRDCISSVIYAVGNTIGLGGFIIFTFMAVNFYWPAETENVIVETNILKTGHLAKGSGSCGSAYAEVLINDTNKQLIFSCDTDLSDFTKVRLTLKKGVLGYYIIRHRELVK